MVQVVYAALRLTCGVQGYLFKYAFSKLKDGGFVIRTQSISRDQPTSYPVLNKG
jgi:hypothetical protein